MSRIYFVTLWLILLISNTIFAANPFRVFLTSAETPEPYASEWGAGKDDSLQDIYKTLQKKNDWIELVGSAEEADVVVEIVGRKYFPGDIVYNPSYSIWGEIVRGSSRYSFIGEYKELCIPCWRFAANVTAAKIQNWIQRNNELIRTNLEVPGAATQNEFPLMDLSDKLPAAGRSVSLKAFVTIKETPAEYKKNWDEKKQDSLKDLKSAIQKDSRFLQLVESANGADVVIEIAGRDTLFDIGYWNRYMVWTSVHLGNKNVEIVGTQSTDAISGWSSAAKDALRQIESWTEQNTGTQVAQTTQEISPAAVPEPPLHASAPLETKNELIQLKQKSTMMEIMLIGDDLEKYKHDHGSAPLSKIGTIQDLSNMKTSHPLPKADAWGKPYLYYHVRSDQAYWIISLGADGLPDDGLYDDAGIPKPEAFGKMQDPDADIIFSDGQFFRSPDF